MRIQFITARSRWDEADELRRVDRRLTLEPCVARRRLRLVQPVEQRLFHGLGRVDRVLAHLVDAEPFDEVVRPLQIIRLLAVVLEEQFGRLERLFGGFDGDRGDRPCERTCRPRRRRPPASCLPVRRDRCLSPWPPRSCADSRRSPIFTLCGVYRFSKRRSSSMPALVESCTPKRQNSVPTHVFTMRTPLVYAWPEGIPRSAHTFGRSSFLTPSRSMRWLPVIFTIGHVVFVRDVGNAPQFRGRGDAAADARNHRKRSVLLNVRVHAIVDEPRGAILVVIAAPDHVQHVAQRRLAHLAARAVAVDVEHLLNGVQIAGRAGSPAGCPARTARTCTALSSPSSSNSGATALQHVLAERRAASAAGARARGFLQLRQRADAAFVNRLDDRALRDADAPADRRVVGHLRDVESGVRRRRRKEQVAALRTSDRSRCAANPCSDGCPTCRRPESRRPACRREA